MLQLIRLFLAQGWKVTFGTVSQKNPKALDLTTLGVTEVSLELNHPDFDKYVHELQPTIVVFDRFMTEEQFGWRVTENCPDALKILDTEDLHCLRKTREKAVKEAKAFTEDDLLSSDIAKREMAAILRCDLSLIISSFEMQLLETIFKIDKTLLYHLPFLLPAIQKETIARWKPFEERRHFITIGNFLHAPNVDATLQLKKHLWKYIRKELPEAELHIYGAYTTRKISQLNDPKEGFIVKGHVKDAYKVMEKARVLLAPLRFGAGIKGKLTDAMLCGTPSVTTNTGAEGMYGNLPWSGFVEDAGKEFAKKAISLYTDKTTWEQAQRKGVAIINTLYDKGRLGNLFVDALIALQTNLDVHRKQNFIGNLLQHHTLQSTKYMSKWITEKNKN